eukprot:1070682-Pleurochrysis_carterae.AAC.2
MPGARGKQGARACVWLCVFWPSSAHAQVRTEDAARKAGTRAPAASAARAAATRSNEVGKLHTRHASLCGALLSSIKTLTALYRPNLPLFAEKRLFVSIQSALQLTNTAVLAPPRTPAARAHT